MHQHTPRSLKEWLESGGAKRGLAAARKLNRQALITGKPATWGMAREILSQQEYTDYSEMIATLCRAADPGAN